MKYIAVTGGVISGIGKGITISSIGRLLKSSGIRVTAIKIDPYLNVDAGTISPFEHGETYVLEDGGETDLDLGNYERHLDITLTRDHNITTGKIYDGVIQKERRGDYLGKTVQMIPHVTQFIQEWIERVAKISVDNSGEPADVCLIELGGTVGDIESMVFLESLRQLKSAQNLILVHVTMIPEMGEQKTKPTQNSVKDLRSIGLSPDIIVCRSITPLQESTREKIAFFCQVDKSCVISAHNVTNIYHIPLLFVEQNLHHILYKKMHCDESHVDLKEWTSLAHRVDSLVKTVRIAIVGKYNGAPETYLSVTKGLFDAGVSLDVRVDIVWIDASKLNSSEDTQVLQTVAGIIIPGGFGMRGIEGKIRAITYAREHNVPCLGICLGFQLMVVEFARNCLGLEGANSEEFDSDAEHKVIVKMPQPNTNMGGTMCIGLRDVIIETGTFAEKIYKSTKIRERHRHRYEVNHYYSEALEKGGMRFSGRSPFESRMEIVELSNHRYFLGVQFHPEFQSRWHKPSPPFYGLIENAIHE